MRAHANLPLKKKTWMAPLSVLMMNTNLMLNSDVDGPVVEDNMVDDGLFVGLFVRDVDDSSCKLTVEYCASKWTYSMSCTPYGLGRFRSTCLSK